MRIIHLLTVLLRDDAGQDLIEYALLVALIAIVAVASITTVGTTVRDVFWVKITNALP